MRATLSITECNLVRIITRQNYTEIAVGLCTLSKNFHLLNHNIVVFKKASFFFIFREHQEGRQMKFSGSLDFEEIPFTPRSYLLKNSCEDCEGKLEFIESPSNKTYELKAVGEHERTATEQDRNRHPRSRQGKAKSYGNCCWILYSR